LLTFAAFDIRLFLSRDRCELDNLAAAHPDRVQKMAALWKEQDDAFTRVRESSPPTGRKRMRPG
jgi:hypothetical protein